MAAIRSTKTKKKNCFTRTLISPFAESDPDEFETVTMYLPAWHFLTLLMTSLVLVSLVVITKLRSDELQQ
jgi:hypothetical protein